MTTILTPENWCPSCGHRFNRASPAFGQDAPKLGDVTICIRCGQVMFFNLDMTARLPEEGELEELDAATLEEICQVQEAIRNARAANN